MSQNLNKVSQENAMDLHSQITHKLTEDGLSPVSSDVEKLLFLWKLYIHTQDELEKARQAEISLKESQAAEMKEVESYVENIRQLSDEREALIQELEVENESLKRRVKRLEEETSKEARAEIVEMLTQQGLAEITSTSSGEQIAYLLVERAQLLERLEEKRHTPGPTSPETEDGRSSETELKRILERERSDLEEELSKQRESAKILSQQLQKEHEEEISALIEENSKLEEDLQNAEMMISQLKAELSGYTEGDDMESSMNEVSLKQGKKKLEEERNQLNQEREEIEKEMEEIENDRADFKKEKDVFNKEKMELEKEKSNLQKEWSKLNQVKAEITEEKEDLAIRREELEKKKQQLDKKEEELDRKRTELEQANKTVRRESIEQDDEEKDSPKSKALKGGSPSRSSDMTLRKIIEDKTKIEGELVQLKAQMREMQREKDAHDDVVKSLKSDLEKSHIVQQQMQAKLRKINEELDDAESQLDDVETNLELVTKEKESISEKFEALSTEVKTLRADAMKSSTLQDIVEILNNDKKQLTASLENMKTKLEQTANEKEELANQTKRWTKEEQDLTNQLQVVKHELDKVTKEREELIKERDKLLSVKAQQEQIEKNLKNELEDLNKTNEKLEYQLSQLKTENQALETKLAKAQESVASAKSQIAEVTQRLQEQEKDCQVQVEEVAKKQFDIDRLKEEHFNIQSELTALQNELVKSKEKETLLITNQHLLQRNHGDTEKRLTHEVADLRQKLELTLQELARSKVYSESLEREKTDLKETLLDTEKLLDQSSEVKNVLEEERREKNKMKVEINRLELSLQEKTTLADKYEEERKEKLNLESQLVSLQNLNEKYKVLNEELNNEVLQKKSLEKQMDELKQNLASKVSKDELVKAEDELKKERELCLQLEVRVKELEHNLKDVEISKESATELLQNERQMRMSLEKNVKDLQVSLLHQDTAEELTRLREELNKHKVAVKALEESEADVQILCQELEKERALTAELNKKIIEMEEASDFEEELKLEQRIRAECEMKVKELEQALDDLRVDSDNMRHSLNGKIKSLEKRVQVLQDDLFTAQDEYQALQDKHNEVVKEAEVARAELITQQVHHSRQTYVSLGSSDHSKKEDTDSLDGAPITPSVHGLMNEINTTKTNLFQAQEELETTKIDLESCRQELSLLQNSVDRANQLLEKSESEARALRRELAETQGTLEFTQNQLKNKLTKLESLARDRDYLQKELDSISDAQQENLSTQPFFEKERQQHIDRITTLENLAEQLELDNRELARKLSAAVAKSEGLEEFLGREKMRNSDKYQQNRRYTDQLEQDIAAANSHIRQLREEVQKSQTKVFKVESDSLGLSAKHESTIARLEQDYKELKQRHRYELDIAHDRLEASTSEIRDLKLQKLGIEEELTQLKNEVSLIQSQNEKLEKHLQVEIKQKQEVTSRNRVIDSELTKSWSQVRSLMEKNTSLESANHSQEQEIIKHLATIRQYESSLSQKETTYEVSTKAIVARAEASERKNTFGLVKDLQRELEAATQKMIYLEKQLSTAEAGQSGFEDTQDRLVTTKHQLEREKLQRTLLDQTVSELKHQVVLLKQREAKLQHTVLDLESQLSRVQNVSSAQHKSEGGQRSLMEQIAKLQQEVKDLQYELYSVSERRDVDMKKYEERKLRTKSKLIKAREFYTNERSKYQEAMKHLDDDLRLTQATLSKELEWKERMDVNYKQMVREKRELITQLSEMEERLKDKTRMVSVLQTRVEYLEEENSRVLDQLENITQQKFLLDKLLKERNNSISSEDPLMGSGGLKPDTSWDTYDRPSHHFSLTVEPPVNFRRTDTSGEHTIQFTQGSGRVTRAGGHDRGGITFLSQDKSDFDIYDDFKLSRDDFGDGDEFEA
ncbi:myosin-6-like [Physella acuta]|uniref:myosin-6-like n=1 Tax=Physella acuta TaxID=109671 RepID=UPI0027DBBD3D|nr:myosin-6-like [Physella acuta]